MNTPDRMPAPAIHLTRRCVLGAGAAGAAALAWPRALNAQTEALIPAEALRADFSALYEGLQEAHFDLYARTSRVRYDRLYRATRAAIDAPMNKTSAERLFQRFVAAGRIAHARIDYLLPAFGAFRAAQGRSLPLNVRIRAGRIFVAEDLSGLRALAAGEEILALQGLEARRLLERLWRHVSADTPYMAQSLIELDFPALVWTELGPLEAFALRVRGADGRIRRVIAPARDAQAMAAAARAPLLNIDPTDRSARMLEGAIAYLRPGIFINLDEGADPYDTRAFHAFIDESFAQFLAAGARALLIDLRDNPGGHNAFSDHLIAWFATRPFRFYSRFAIRASAQAISANAARLAPSAPGAEIAQMLADAYAGARSPGDIVELDAPASAPREGERFGGPVFALINRRAYSNSVASAALIQDYGFGRVLGEETSDLATTYGAMEQFTLPLSGIVVGYPKAFIVRPSGDLEPRGVVPDAAIETPLIEGPDDLVLHEARAIAAANRGL